MKFTIVLFFLLTISTMSHNFIACENVTPSEYTLFETILHQFKDYEKLVKIDKDLMTKRKTNFSFLWRINIIYTTKTLDDDHEPKSLVNKTMKFIMKKEPKKEEMEDPEQFEAIQHMKVFDTEARMLREIIPWIEEAVGCKIGPKYYYYSEIDKILIMEDLVFSGLNSKKRGEAFTDNDVTSILHLMADLHAGSVLLHEKNSTAVSNFKTGLLHPERIEKVSRKSANILKSLANHLNSLSDKKFKLLSEKIVKLSNVLIHQLPMIYTVNDGEFVVLNHGDFWHSNFMLGMEKNENLPDVRLLDFQEPLWSSPTIDLLYFFGCTGTITQKFQDYIIAEAYLMRLSETMKKIGCSTLPPNIDQLKASMYQRRVYLTYEALALEPRGLMRYHGIDITRKGEMETSYWNNSALKLTIESVLPFLDAKGYLD